MLSILLSFACCLSGKVNIGALNVRSQPTKVSKKIGLVYKNQELEILETIGQWYKIKFEDGEGYVARMYVTVGKPRPTSNGTGDSIVAKARSKLGCKYVYGATGPNTFDCSGLTQWCHKQVGISIPRTASQQSQQGTKVSQANLKPGDVCCFYSPVSHVGIYIGNGNCIHAPKPGDVVKTTGIKYMNFQFGRRYW
ncbi:SH3-domain-containing protein [Histomonas meleagridis]|uniref:SH3-domain-containing protein n=1 Tax=Histomonas meleagridis TaxID=135588 RepID=UPI003559F780|nr:SH3-domain-containing protein [Histomonas meleagridis]KAH0802637.1 SH3-domain-containing protein [Histomonas meleagridis]